jgi:hypothetical protein
MPYEMPDLVMFPAFIYPENGDISSQSIFCPEGCTGYRYKRSLQQNLEFGGTFSLFLNF